MKCLALACALLLGSCARHNAHAPRPKAEAIRATLPPGDTEFTRINSDNPAENGPARLVTPGPQKGILGRIFGSKTASESTAGHVLPGPQNVAIPRKCKGCTFNVVAGNQSNSTVGKKATAATAEGATATTIGKAKGPTAIGDSATSTDNTKAGQRGGAAATAPNATATATTVKPPTPWLKYALWASGLGFTAWVLFGGGGAILLALCRKNKPTENQV